MAGVGCAVSVDEGMDVSVAAGVVIGTAIGRNVSHAIKNNRYRTENLVFMWLIVIEN